jgi:hypothetical protein
VRNFAQKKGPKERDRVRDINELNLGCLILHIQSQCKCGDMCNQLKVYTTIEM